jgi:CRP/FNR family transcriptional regulator, cyclic AMP receptor protein
MGEWILSNEVSVTWIDLLGYAASATVLATFCMNTMIPLRITAILSNILFASFGLKAHIYPVLILHVILLPVNTLRLIQIRRVVRGTLQRTDLSMKDILPIMTPRRFRAGETLIRKDEPADRLFYLDRGEAKVVEIGKTVSSGSVLGEIGIFACNQRRTSTVVCVTDCEMYELSESKTKELYYQDPSFGYAVFQLVITRLLENMNVFPQPASLATSTPR